MASIDEIWKKSIHRQEIKIALYSIDCVRKLLLNHHVDNDFIFARLDEAREAEMSNDQEFWELSSQIQTINDNKKLNEESKQSQIALLKSHK